MDMIIEVLASRGHGASLRYNWMSDVWLSIVMFAVMLLSALCSGVCDLICVIVCVSVVKCGEWC